MPPIRPMFPVLNERGSGWRRCGYRSRGEMWVNIKIGSYGRPEGQPVSEYLTINQFWDLIIRSVVNMQNGFPIIEGWSIGLYSDRKVLPQTNEPITSIFAGGETVTVKVFDEGDQERVYKPFEGWVMVHSP